MGLDTILNISYVSEGSKLKKEDKIFEYKFHPFDLYTCPQVVGIFSLLNLILV